MKHYYLLSTIHASYESHLERVHECVGSSEEDEGYIDARQVSSNHARDRDREVGGYEGGNRFSIIIMEFIFAARCSSVVRYIFSIPTFSFRPSGYLWVGCHNI